MRWGWMLYGLLAWTTAAFALPCCDFSSGPFQNCNNTFCPSTTSTTTTTTTRPPTSTTTTTATTTTTRASTTTLITGSSGLLGFLPGIGSPTDITVDPATNRAYLSSYEFGLTVADVSFPTKPVVLGAPLTPFAGYHLARAGTLAAVDAGTGGVRLYDLTSPITPALLATISAAALGGSGGVGVTFASPTLLLVLLSVGGNPGHSDLVAVNVATPTAPTILGRLSFAPGTAGYHVRVVGTMAYVACGTAGLKIVDLTNPAMPTVLATLDTPGNTADVALNGSLAYLADTSALRIADVSTPTAPVLLGSFVPIAAMLMVQATPTALYAGNGANLYVLDTTAPSAPVLRSTTRVSTNGLAIYTVAGHPMAAIAAQTVLRGSQGGLYVYDVTTPTAPALVSRTEDSWSNGALGVSGGLAVAGGGERGLKVVDVTNPNAPSLLATLPMSVFAPGAQIGAVAIKNTTAWVTVTIPGNPGHDDLVTLDLANPAAPVLTGRTSLAPIGGSRTIRVDGATAYLPWSGGLALVSIATPTPALLATVDTPSQSWDVAIDGVRGLAFIADMTSVQIVDVSTPDTAHLLGSYPVGAQGIATVGTKVYIATGSALAILDTTTPTTPTLLATLGSVGSAQGIAAAGTTVFLAAPALSHSEVAGGFYKIDVTNPAAPKMLAHFQGPGNVKAMIADGGRFYAADYNAVLDVVR